MFRQHAQAVENITAILARQKLARSRAALFFHLFESHQTGELPPRARRRRSSRGLGNRGQHSCFNIVNNIFFRPLPFQADDRLFALDGSMIGPAGDRIALSFREATFARIENATRSFLRLAAVRSEDMTLMAEKFPSVSRDVELAGTCEILASVRLSDAGSMQRRKVWRSDRRSAVISHSLWQRYFGGVKAFRAHAYS